MADKILSEHTLYLENRKNMKITGVTQVVAYDERKVVLKTDYGRVVISGKNIVAGEISTNSKTMQITGDIDLIQYQATKGKSEGGLAKLFR